MRVLIIPPAGKKAADLPNRPNTGEVIKTFPNGTMVMDIEEDHLGLYEVWATVHNARVRPTNTPIRR